MIDFDTAFELESAKGKRRITCRSKNVDIAGFSEDANDTLLALPQTWFEWKDQKIQHSSYWCRQQAFSYPVKKQSLLYQIPLGLMQNTAIWANWGGKQKRNSAKIN